MNPYAIAFAALAKAYKIAKGVSPKGLDLLKLKQQARQKAIDAQKVIKVNFDKGNNWMKNQADRIKQYNRQNKESAQRFKEKMKKEKSLGDKLKDYKGDPDAMREGGLLGYAVGGRIQNLRNAYQSNPTLQNQFADQQDYIDLFDLNTNQFTPTTKSAPASLNTSTPQEILTPNIVKPIIIPGSESEGITSINRSRTNMNQPNAMGGKTPGLKAAAQRSLTGLQTLLDSPFVEFNPLNPMFLFNLAKAGKEKITKPIF